MIATLTPSAKEKYPTDPDAIESVDVLWTSKKKLKAWVESFGRTMDLLMEDAKELRREIDEGGSMVFKRRYPHGAFWLSFSSNLEEQPVNLVIPRKTLEGLSVKCFAVTAGNRGASK